MTHSHSSTRASHSTAPPDIHIQQINIRTQGLPVHTVRTAISAMGPALQAEVARIQQQNQRPNQQQINRALTVPRLQLSAIQARGDTQQLCQAIARSIANGIYQSLNRSHD